MDTFLTGLTLVIFVLFGVLMVLVVKDLVGMALALVHYIRGRWYSWQQGRSQLSLGNIRSTWTQARSLLWGVRPVISRSRNSRPACLIGVRTARG
jgi:hypothetical protein